MNCIDISHSRVDQDAVDESVQGTVHTIQMFGSLHVMLFPLAVGTRFNFVNMSVQTMRSAQNWKSGLQTCTLFETCFASSVVVSLCQLALSNDDI